MPGHAGDVHAGATRGDHFLELLQDHGGAVQIHSQDRLRRRLHGREPGGADDLRDVTLAGCGLGEGVDRPTVGHVDVLCGDDVAGGLERLGGGLQGVRDTSVIDVLVRTAGRAVGEDDRVDARHGRGQGAGLGQVALHHLRSRQQRPRPVDVAGQGPDA